MSKARDLANAGTALGAVTATELAYVDGVTSAIQTQIDGKQAINANVSTTELGYLDGVTSAIQTQLDAKTVKATLTTKGDIYAATAASTPDRLAVGANDTVLTADSTAATGLKWATPSAGGMTLLSTTTLSGATTTISSISSAYTRLHVNIVGINNGTRTKYRIRPNAATNLAVYGGRTSNSGNSASLNGYQAGSAEAIAMNDYSTIALNQATANCWTLTIDNYSGSVTPKNFLLYGSWFGDDESSMIYSGQIRTASAISSLVIAADAGSMTAGTVYLYGVK